MDETQVRQPSSPRRPVAVVVLAVLGAVLLVAGVSLSLSALALVFYLVALAGWIALVAISHDAVEASLATGVALLGSVLVIAVLRAVT